ncbi:Hypothetical protein I595_489 [Croceitalea dokdonensis DOKDO 023]|uniref:TonB-dependent receptor plug n=1 Tax=Croceitalea dokdonensis DOKDO 023 TaxID=1300341 RepID=A0A0P7AJ05_9FLAO|nr:hypothetical protein [Croceitalea dokdonensis]KPM33586.1 Hypothetical protein I595_489 [Croceitalea dokdonensis DOKDO 023]
MKQILVFVVVMLFPVGLISQYIIKSKEELENLKKLPQEKMYIDHTGPVVLAGEYLYYATYTFNAQTNKLTDISTVGYVALVDQNQNYVFEHKIKLTKGLGQGDFFVTTQVPSGTYKLLGYTQWMKNNGLKQVFKDDIVIINPYLADQAALLAGAGDSKDVDALTSTPKKAILDSSTVSITTDKMTYAKREKVKLSVRNYKGYLGNGAYTLEVRKKSQLETFKAMDAAAYANGYFNVDKVIPQNVGDSLFLPEQRGELFFGKVLNTSNTPIANKPVVISVPGKEFLLKFSQTDDDGNFYAYFKKDYKTPRAVVQVEEEESQYTIKEGVLGRLDISSLQFSKYRLRPEFKKILIDRSVHNQIENQFFEIKPDSILQGDAIDPFDGGTPETITLDDYTRFATFEETLVEVVPNAGYRNGGKGNDYVKVQQDFETYNEDYNSYPAIVVIDGVFIPNHEAVRNFDARTIEKISLIRDQFRLGGKDYQGILSVETFDGNYLESHNYVNSKVMPLAKPRPTKNYYNQRYDSDTFGYGRIPDFRYLLFWKPHVVIANNNGYDYEFFTSDVSGEFEVVLNGFTTYGKPITITKMISVLDTTDKSN